MKIFIKNIELVNFKGIAKKGIDFTGSTLILGDNGTGKTTVFDAFLWLLFGKDSTDRKEFQIKPLDENNQPKHRKVDSEVTGTFIVDGHDVELKRTFREKWVKKRGQETPEFKGNETIFNYNGVPVSAKEYKDKVNTIVDENLFKLITNPHYFNSIKWQDRRNVLFELSGGLMSDQEIAAGNQKFTDLLSLLNGSKTIAEFKREIAAKKKKLNDELKNIPARIDELTRSMPETLDFSSIEKEIEEKEKEIKNLDTQLSNITNAYSTQSQKQQDHYSKIGAINLKISKLENNAKIEAQKDSQNKALSLQEVNSKISNLKRESEYLIEKNGKLTTDKSDLLDKIQGVRDEWHIENAKELTFKDNEFHCPTCKREFEASDIGIKKAEMQKNFISHKTTKLEHLTARGKRMSLDVDSCDSSIEVNSNRIQTIKTLLEELNLQKMDIDAIHIDSVPDLTLLESNSEYISLKSDLKTLEENPIEIKQVDTSSISSQKTEIKIKVDALKNQLTSRDVISRTKTRIEELESRESDLAQSIADFEKQEFVIDDFNKTKITTIENRINSMFQHVKFKMFETQINGGEVECCETLVDGVPFQDANNAAQINSGLDIINTISAHHNIYAPIFIDNRESVNEIISTETQIVSLVVSKDPELKIA